MNARIKIVEIFEDMFNGVDESGVYPTSTAYTRLEMLVNQAQMEAVGYAYATCCMVLDAGKDPRTEEVPGMFERALQDLNDGVRANTAPQCSHGHVNEDKSTGRRTCQDCGSEVYRVSRP